MMPQLLLLLLTMSSVGRRTGGQAGEHAIALMARWLRHASAGRPNQAEVCVVLQVAFKDLLPRSLLVPDGCRCRRRRLRRCRRRRRNIISVQLLSSLFSFRPLATKRFSHAESSSQWPLAEPLRAKVE